LCLPEPENIMTSTYSAVIVQAYQQTLTRILTLAERLSEEQLCWQPQPGAPSIAFQLWHVARWADHLQAALPGMTPELGRRLGPGQEIWLAEQLAAAWGFDPETLGHAETGMGMEKTQATALTWPAKATILFYAKSAFGQAERAVSAIDDAQFLAAEAPQARTADLRTAGSTVGRALTVHLTHTNRHLGMIEALLGLQTGSGTATV
jgi:uncharacterized damage-inducible protein DinB